MLPLTWRMNVSQELLAERLWAGNDAGADSIQDRAYAVQRVLLLRQSYCRASGATPEDRIEPIGADPIHRRQSQSRLAAGDRGSSTNRRQHSGVQKNTLAQGLSNPAEPFFRGGLSADSAGNDEDGVASAAVLHGLIAHFALGAEQRVIHLNESFRSALVPELVQQAEAGPRPIKDVFALDRAFPSVSVNCSPAVNCLRSKAGSAPVPTGTDGGGAGERSPEISARSRRPQP
jgi:hypothetical protein